MNTSEGGSGKPDTTALSLDSLYPKAIKVIIVSGHDAAARSFLRLIFDERAEFRLVGDYTSGEEAIREALFVNPQIVLMEICLPGISGFECTRRLKIMLPGLTVVLVSRRTDSKIIAAALAAGGDGFLTKPVGRAQCLATVRFALRGSRSSWAGGGGAGLTNRENDVMRCLAQGLLYKEAADKLKISYSAVHKYQHKAFQKLGASNRSEAIRNWLRKSAG